jgi:hypothetical protein
MTEVIRIHYVGTYYVVSPEFIAAWNATADLIGSSGIDVIPVGNGQAAIYYSSIDTV